MELRELNQDMGLNSIESSIYMYVAFVMTELVFSFMSCGGSRIK